LEEAAELFLTEVSQDSIKTDATAVPTNNVLIDLRLSI
jgi:hypothetical protein